MTTFHTSKGTRAQHVSPKYQSRPYRPCPARRQHIYGRIQPMEQPRDSTAKWFIVPALIIAAFFALQLARPLLGHHAASDARPLASGTTATPSDAGSSHP